MFFDEGFLAFVPKSNEYLFVLLLYAGLVVYIFTCLLTSIRSITSNKLVPIARSFFVNLDLSNLEIYIFLIPDDPHRLL